MHCTACSISRNACISLQYRLQFTPPIRKAAWNLSRNALHDWAPLSKCSAPPLQCPHAPRAMHPAIYLAIPPPSRNACNSHAIPAPVFLQCLHCIPALQNCNTRNPVCNAKRHYLYGPQCILHFPHYLHRLQFILQ
jgi:hypothetical protein